MMMQVLDEGGEGAFVLGDGRRTIGATNYYTWHLQFDVEIGAE